MNRYDVRAVVGDYFEDFCVKIFDLEKTNDTALPDLQSKDKSFFVEVKGSGSTHGSVINETQLYKFDETIDARRFYANCFHSINASMQKLYKTEKDLKKGLKERFVGLYLFPFSIMKAHFENSNKIKSSKHDTYVQLRESIASKIFDEDIISWGKLKLSDDDYSFKQLHNKIFLVTREGNLEKEIEAGFNSRFI